MRERERGREKLTWSIKTKRVDTFYPWPVAYSVSLLPICLYLHELTAQIYPSDIFERRRLYNVAVSKSRHPGLNEYIRETVYSLKPWIEGGELERLAMVFLDREDKPLERLVFQVRVDPKELDSGEVSYEELEHQLRGAFVKMQVGLTTLPEGEWALGTA